MVVVSMWSAALEEWLMMVGFVEVVVVVVHGGVENPKSTAAVELE